MTRRIVGQCHQADFREIEHLAVVLKDPEMFDVSTLTNRQKFAFHFMALAKDRGIPWKMLGVVQEVLFWGNDKDVSAVEIKFTRDPRKRDKVREFKRLW